MTLQNGLVFGDSAFLWCDTAYFDGPTGNLVCFDTKAFVGLFWPFAGTLSSNGGNPHEIARQIGAAAPANVPELLRDTAWAIRAYAAQGYLARVLLATFDDRPRLWMVASDSFPGERPFEPFELTSYVCSGNHLPAVRRGQERGFTPRRMARAIDAQIAEPFDLAESAAGAGRRQWFGGNVVELEVSASGVESRVLRTVGDKHGSQ